MGQEPCRLRREMGVQLAEHWYGIASGDDNLMIWFYTCSTCHYKAKDNKDLKQHWFEEHVD